MEEKYKKFLETEFVIFDIETSGLNPAYDEILEIAAIKLRGKEIVNRFEALVQPTKAVSSEVEKIHGLNELFLLVNGRGAKEILAEFFTFIDTAIVVGHNIKEFDWLFILNHLKKLSLPAPEKKFIDTLELSRKLLVLPKYNLTEVARHFGLEHLNAHRAMADVEVNTKVFVALMELLLNKKE